MPPELGILFVSSKSTEKFQKEFRIAARCKFRPKRPISGNFHSISYSFIERNCLKTNLEKSCKRKLFVLAVVKFYKTECSMERKLRWFWPFFAPYLKMEAIPEKFLLQIFSNWSLNHECAIFSFIQYVKYISTQLLYAYFYDLSMFSKHILAIGGSKHLFIEVKLWPVWCYVTKNEIFYAEKGQKAKVEWSAM